jgi:hypothetical protein
MRIMDPGSWARAKSAGGAMPPLWQYSARQSHKKPDETIAAPKGCGPRIPQAFSPANKQFLGDRGKGP